MTAEGIQRAADLLWQHWQAQTCIPGLPDDLRPSSREEAYAIQATVEARSTRPRVGWKIAATSKAGQAHIAVDGPLAGRLLPERVFESGSDVAFGRHPQMRCAEAEFAFRLGRDVVPRPEPYTADEVLARVDALHPAIELPDSRYDDVTQVGGPQLIADNACAHHFVLGPAAPDLWRSLDLVAHTVSGRAGSRTREGAGANVLGDPRIALVWLVNEITTLGLTLRAGEVITTGTCLVPLPVEAGDDVRMDFGILGRVESRMR